MLQKYHNQFLFSGTQGMRDQNKFLGMVNTGPSQSIEGVNTMGKIVKTTIQVKITWDNQAVKLTTNDKFYVPGLKSTQPKQ